MGLGSFHMRNYPAPYRIVLHAFAYCLLCVYLSAVIYTYFTSSKINHTEYQCVSASWYKYEYL